MSSIRKMSMKGEMSSKGKTAVIITKDEDYFMESTFMVFQVERCLFRVPSYLFSKESHVFGGMFRLPQLYPHENGDAESLSEANPIILPDEFSKADFRSLLKALYPLSFTIHLTLTKEEWLSVLKLSTKWYFLNLRRTAISELKRTAFDPRTLSPVENIAYGRKYRISDWLLSGFADLVMREESINDDEALDIDSDYPTTTYKLFRTRELRFRGFLASRVAAIKEIESLFKDELTQIRDDEMAYLPEFVLEDIKLPALTEEHVLHSKDDNGKFKKEEVKPCLIEEPSSSESSSSSEGGFQSKQGFGATSSMILARTRAAIPRSRGGRGRARR